MTNVEFKQISDYVKKIFYGVPPSIRQLYKAVGEPVLVPLIDVNPTILDMVVPRTAVVEPIVIPLLASLVTLIPAELLISLF